MNSLFAQCPNTFCGGRLLPVQIAEVGVVHTFRIDWRCSTCGYEVGKTTQPARPNPPKPASHQ